MARALVMTAGYAIGRARGIVEASMCSETAITLRYLCSQAIGHPHVSPTLPYPARRDAIRDSNSTAKEKPRARNLEAPPKGVP